MPASVLLSSSWPANVVERCRPYAHVCTTPVAASAPSCPSPPPNINAPVAYPSPPLARSYFDEKGLVRQQLDSFNEFIELSMQQIVTYGNFAVPL